MGKHYYAKIGNMEVVSEDGKNKWNTPEEANRQALLYFERKLLNG